MKAHREGCTPQILIGAPDRLQMTSSVLLWLSPVVAVIRSRLARLRRPRCRPFTGTTQFQTKIEGRGFPSWPGN